MLDAFGEYRPVFVAICTALIILRGIQLGSLRLYGSYYFFVFSYFVAIVLTLIGASVWGTSGIRYVYLYVGVVIVTHVTTGVFLVSLIALMSNVQLRDIIGMICFLLFALAFELVYPEGHFVLHIWRGGFFFLSFVALLAIYRCLDPMRELGKNMTTALFSTFALLVLQSLNAHSYLSSNWNYENYRNLANLGSVVTWGLMAWGMWDLDPPERKSKKEKET